MAYQRFLSAAGACAGKRQLLPLLFAQHGCRLMAHGVHHKWRWSVQQTGNVRATRHQWGHDTSNGSQINGNPQFPIRTRHPSVTRPGSWAISSQCQCQGCAVLMWMQCVDAVRMSAWVW